MSGPRQARKNRAAKPKSARETALNVLYQVESRKAFADLLLGQALKQGSLDPRDAALATELVNGTLRWRMRLDWILSHYVRAGLETLTPWVRNILRLGLYQLAFLDKIPPHAAVDESVKLAKKYANPGAAGLVNAVLRRLLREDNELPDPERMLADKVEGLCTATSHPRWLVERWVERFGQEEARELLMADNRARPLGLRVNMLHTDRETLRRALEARGITTEASPYSKYALRAMGNLVPAEVPEFQQGHFFVQDESETLVVELLDPQPGETILDLCAAPGGKTTHIQEIRRNQGTVIAVDVQEPRLARIQENVDRLGLEGVQIVLADGLEYRPESPVDRVLVDAPCSGLGVLARRSDARWRKTPESLKQILPLQRALLDAAARHLRPGGVLVYSVCSFELEETFAQVQGFLKRNPEFVLDPVPAEFSAVAEDGALLLLPNRHGTDGAFAARFVRKG